MGKGSCNHINSVFQECIPNKGQDRRLNSPILLVLLTQNANGSFQYNPAGAFDYLAVGNYSVDSYTYMITDSDGSFDNATISAEISNVDYAPL